uniref:C2H2-type domain-containing protein n=1 Tax=Hymenolepis diminuta TaxID=6216 RepID=A0A0R3SC84_HYMDI
LFDQFTNFKSGNRVSTKNPPVIPLLATLPTILSVIQFESHSAIHLLKKRGRIGETCVRKTGEARLFRCNQCDDMFYSLRDLENHTQETHGGYKCHLCKMAFTQRSNLQRHALKHVDFRPFECNLCGRAYYRKNHLMKHMQRIRPLCPLNKNIPVILTIQFAHT